MPEINVTIYKKGGKVEIEGHGFTGGACQTHIDKLLKEFGKVENREQKPEFAVQHVNQDQVQTVKRG